MQSNNQGDVRSSLETLTLPLIWLLENLHLPISRCDLTASAYAKISRNLPNSCSNPSFMPFHHGSLKRHDGNYQQPYRYCYYLLPLPIKAKLRAAKSTGLDKI